MLRPFSRFCVHIGAIPESIIKSMSYEEQLLGLIKFLKEKLIPAVDHNADVIEEIQNWFDNLDVQDEIDNKLDKMVEDGTFDEIINQELFSQINQNIQNNTNDINLINSEKTIMIGDSYSLTSSGWIGWQDTLQQLLGLTNNDVIKISNNGGGFARIGDNGTFLQVLQNTSISDKNLYKRIIVCGGINDANTTYVSKQQLDTAIQNFMNYCKTNYPNAIVYVGHISGHKPVSNESQLTRFRMINQSLPCYINVRKYGGVYLNGVEYIMKNYDNYYNDSHPNDEGCRQIAYGIYQALQNGYCKVNYERVSNIQCTNNTVSGDTNINYTFINNQFEMDCIQEYGSTITFTNVTTVEGIVDLGTYDIKYFRNVNPISFNTPVELILFDNNNSVLSATSGLLYINNGHLYIRTHDNTKYQTVKSIRLRAFNNLIDGIYC